MFTLSIYKSAKFLYKWDTGREELTLLKYLHQTFGAVTSLSEISSRIDLGERSRKFWIKIDGGDSYALKSKTEIWILFQLSIAT